MVSRRDVLRAEAENALERLRAARLTVGDEEAKAEHQRYREARDRYREAVREERTLVRGKDGTVKVRLFVDVEVSVEGSQDDPEAIQGASFEALRHHSWLVIGRPGGYDGPRCRVTEIHAECVYPDEAGTIEIDHPAEGELSVLERDLLARGKLIMAIKEVRARTGLSLIDAKRLVDRHR